MTDLSLADCFVVAREDVGASPEEFQESLHVPKFVAKEPQERNIVGREDVVCCGLTPGGDLREEVEAGRLGETRVAFLGCVEAVQLEVEILKVWREVCRKLVRQRRR